MERLHLLNIDDLHKVQAYSQLNRGGGGFDTPGGRSGGGGGVTPYITRGTKTGNKVLSLWKGGKRNGKRRKSNEREEGSGDEGYC